LPNASRPRRSAEELARYAPISGMVLPRFAAPPTFLRLKHLSIAEAAGKIDVGVIGVPFDAATTNRPGTRHGPRQIRDQSTLMRLINEATLVSPYEHLAFADLGDVPINPVDVADTIVRIERSLTELVGAGMIPLSVGGDHLVSYPILRVVGRERPVGLIHVDAHSDTNDRYFGGDTPTHGSPFRKAIEDGVIDPKRTVQIGLRGTLYSRDERDWGKAQGITMLPMEEVAERGMAATVAEARRVVGDGPVYLTYDIDSIDPAYAPGTGTPEVGGLTSREALRLLRGLRGLDYVGADLVEVSPPLDPSGTTALLGAAILFELACLIAEPR
jgi:guanidinopropionase